MKQDKNERIGWGLSILLHLVLFIVLAISGFFNYLEQQKPPLMVDVIYEAVSGSSGGGSAGSDSNSSDSSVLDSNIAVPKPEQPTTQLEEQKPTSSDRKQKEKPSQTAESASNTGSNSGKSNGTGKGQGSETADGIKGNGQGGGDSDGGDNLEPATPLRVLSRTNPAYPEEVRRQGISGTVSIRAVIGTDGSIEGASITASSGSSALDQAALTAFYQWSFAPAKNARGRAVRCYISQSFVFNLN